MKKTFLFLAALAMSAMTWAETASVELCTSWDKTLAYATNYTQNYTIDDLNGGETTMTLAVKGVFRQKATDASFQMNKKEGYFKNTTALPGKITKIETTWSAAKGPTKCYFATDAEASASDAVVEVSSATSVTYTPDDEQEYYYFNIDVKTGSGSAQMTSCVVYYEPGTPSTVTLDSLVIKGTASKLEYFVGEAFDPAGLEVWGIYTKTVKGDSTSQITSGITWTTDPEVLAKEDISVAVTAQYKDFTSEVFTVNNIVVKEKPAAKYVPVAWNEIEDGGKYFITANNDGEYYFAAKAFAAKGALAIAFDASMAPEADMWTFTKSGDVWKISAADGAGLYMNNDNNGLVCAANKGADFTVAQGSSAEFTDLTASDGTNTRYIALYNQQDFRCYKTSGTSGIRDLKLYGLKKEGVITKPSFAPSAGDFDQEVEVTLTAEEGAEIFYALNEEVTSMNAIQYTEPIKLTETTTIYAVAKKDGKESEQASKTYTLIPTYTLAELVAAGAPTAEKKKVILVLDKEEITGIDGTRGIYVKSGDQEIEIFCYNLPETAVKGGTVSGRAMGDWFLYGTQEPKKWELQPADWDWATFAAPSPTGINNAKANTKATKAIVNGQIVIVRDNKTYNVLGF